MDIRVKKTKRAIQKAFVALLREKPIEKITVKEIAERAEINKTTFYSHYETLDALTAEMERQTVQLVCDNMGGAQQLLDTPEAFVREMFANLQQATDYLGVVPASAMNRFTQHLRDAVLEQIKSDNIEPSQYENVGAILIFVMNGLSGLLNTDAKLAQKQIDVIAAITWEKTVAAMQKVIEADDFSDAMELTDDMTAAATAQGGTLAAVYQAQSGGQPVGYAINVEASGSQGTISMMVGIDMDGAVTGVSIVTNSETSGIGSKVMSNEPLTNGTRVLDQFIGKSAADGVLSVGSNVDAITGATVSTKGVTTGVNAALAAAGVIG